MFDYNEEKFDDAARARFSSRYTVDDNTGCWIWRGPLDNDGYGQITIRGVGYRPHRVSYMMYNGDITSGLYVLHKCDRPSCVNPSHLFLGTQAENVLDCMKKGRRSVGFYHYRSKLDGNSINILVDLLKRGYHYTYIAKKLNMSSSSIKHIAAGYSRKDLGTVATDADKKPSHLKDDPERLLYWTRSNSGWKLIKRQPENHRRRIATAAIAEKNKNKKCIVCGNPYISLRPSKYCSMACSAKGFRKNNPNYHKKYKKKYIKKSLTERRK